MSNLALGYVARERGAALIAVMLMSTVIVTVALMAAYTARLELRIAQNQFRGFQALYSAEAGLNHAFRVLALNPNRFDAILAGNGVGDVFSTGIGTGLPVTIGTLLYRFRNFPGPGPGTDGYYVRLQDNLDETPNNPNQDADGEITVVSRGQSGDAVKVVEGVFRRTTGFCLFGTVTGAVNGVRISGGVVDSYNSALGTYAATQGNNAQVGTNANVNMSGGSQIRGDVSARGTITATTITGTQTTGAAIRTFPPVPACGPPYSGTAGITGTYTYSGTATGDLLASGGSGNIILAPGTYCFNDITLNGGSRLTINAGPVVVNLTGELNFTGGSQANNTTQLPANLRFFSSFAGGANNDLSGGSGAFMTVYAPEANIVISGGSSLFGSLIGRTLTFTGGGTGIHCDLNASGGGSSGFQLVEWRQVQ